MNLDRSAWKRVKLGDVAYEYSKRIDKPSESGFDRFVGSANIGQFDFRIKSWESTDDVESSMKQFQVDDYLLVRRSLYASDFRERAPLADFDGICSGDILTIRENPKKIAKGFLIGVLNSPVLWKYIVANASGSITRRIKWKELANFEFLLPPKDQQARLAELLWAADELIERYGTVIDKNSLVLKIFQQQTFQNKTEIIRIKDVAKFSSGATPLRAENTKYFANGTIPWVKTLDLNNGIIEDTEEKITETALNETSCKKLPVGTVLVAMYGGFNQIGRTGILSIEAATNQALCAILPDRTKVLPEYLLLSLNSLREYWKIVAVSSRKDPNITKSDVENFPFYFPDLLKQAEIIRQVEMINATHKKLTDTIEQSKQIQKQLINQIFSAP